MEELYALIEEKIERSGYPGVIDGEEFYDYISMEAEEREDGTYLFTLNKGEELTYQGCMTVTEEEFDLHYVDIVVGEETYHVDFDA